MRIAVERAIRRTPERNVIVDIAFTQYTVPSAGEPTQLPATSVKYLTP